MNQLLSPGFLFRWSIPIRQVTGIPNKSSPLLNLPESCRLPSLGELDSLTEFADVRMAWNFDGLAVSVRVHGWSQVEKVRPTDADFNAVRLLIDTRNTQGIHRATRFCHQFLLHASKNGRKADPGVVQIPLARAREESSMANVSLIRLHSEMFPEGYLLEAWFPSAALLGFDPDSFPRLGFHYRIRDRQLGEQFLSVGTEFPVETDPSLWQTLELAKP